MKKYVIKDNKLYEKIENELFDTYKELNVPRGDPDSVWKGAKIPYDMWNLWKSFALSTKESETMALLFYDNGWSMWIPPQITSGMTVKTNPNDAQYALQRKKFPDLMFGTIHHHCSTSAFQSGTDEADETNKEGVHITLGNLQSAKLSVHVRLILGKTQTTIQLPDIVEAPEWLNQIPEYMRNGIIENDLLHPHIDPKFEEEIELYKKNVSKPHSIYSFESWKQACSYEECEQSCFFRSLESIEPKTDLNNIWFLLTTDYRILNKEEKEIVAEVLQEYAYHFEGSLIKLKDPNPSYAKLKEYKEPCRLLIHNKIMYGNTTEPKTAEGTEQNRDVLQNREHTWSRDARFSSLTAK